MKLFPKRKRDLERGSQRQRNRQTRQTDSSITKQKAIKWKINLFSKGYVEKKMTRGNKMEMKINKNN